MENSIKVKKRIKTVKLNSRYSERVLGKTLEFTKHSLERVCQRSLEQSEVAESIRKGNMYFMGGSKFIVSHEIFKIVVDERSNKFKVVSVMYHNDFARAITRYMKQYGVSRSEAVSSLKRVSRGKFRGGENRRLVGMSINEFVSLASAVACKSGTQIKVS